MFNGVPDTTGNSHQRCSVKKVLLKISQNSQENTCTRAFFLIKLQASAYSFIKKEILAQVFSYEFCEIFKNTFLIEHLQWLLLYNSGRATALFWKLTIPKSLGKLTRKYF